MIVVLTADEADRILDQLRHGADFAALAMEKSIDPTARDGGYLGEIDPATLRPELRDALSGVRQGELTVVVRIPSGFAILKVLSAAEVSGRANAGSLHSPAISSRRFSIGSAPG
jgi:parvulin-like peptidyl-prolyl isomerase